MVLRGIDGKIQHLKELAFIEKMLYEEVISPVDYYDELGKYLRGNFDLGEKSYWTQQDLKKIDDFTNQFFSGRINESKVWLLRAYVIGRYLGLADFKGESFKAEMLSKLPKTIQEAMKKYGLSVEGANALKIAIEEGAANMSNTTANTIQAVRETIVESTKAHGNSSDVLDRLKKMMLKEGTELGELNRDWQRVAIHETNKIFNDGYLAAMNDGDFVVGISMPDACEYCMDLINGKVYRVRKEPAPDYSNMRGEEKEKWMRVWETEVWAGKTNMGRSTAKRKRINPLVGNKEDNLRYREHEELSMPTIPLHVICRCRYMRINPEFQWVDEDDRMRLRAEDESGWRKWRDILYREYNIKNKK